jgi:Lysozyme inhibitor LprI
MLRLAAVFLVWIASTAWALDDADADYDAELHEAYVLAWSEADDRQRRLLERAQRGWNDYRAANCEIVGSSCSALMAQERAAELRHLLTNKNGRTILRSHGRTDRSESELRQDER